MLPDKTFSGVKWPECEADNSNSHLLSADIKSVYHYTSISSYTFMAQYISSEKFCYYPGLEKKLFGTYEQDFSTSVLKASDL